LLFSSFAGAQTLQGVVVDANTGRPMYLVSIVNKHTQQVAFTDEKGFYSIPAVQGEVVLFSFIGYTPVERPKPPSVILATLNILMEPLEYQLKEFRFLPGHLTKYQSDSAERVSIYKIQLQREPPSPFNSPASAIAELFSKRAKRTYQFQKNFAAGEIEKFVDTRYTPALVTTLTGLTGDSIGHFMYAFPMPYDFARAGSDLEIKVWIRENFKKFREDAATRSRQDSLKSKKNN
jgi:hypothetical protein